MAMGLTLTTILFIIKHIGFAIINNEVKSDGFDLLKFGLVTKLSVTYRVE